MKIKQLLKVAKNVFVKCNKALIILLKETNKTKKILLIVMLIHHKNSYFCFSFVAKLLGQCESKTMTVANQAFVKGAASDLQFGWRIVVSLVKLLFFHLQVKDNDLFFGD